MAWTTLDLLSTITNRAMIPDASSGSFAAATLLNYASEELRLPVMRMITGVREKYYETFQDTAVAAGTSIVPIPARAIGGAVSCVQFLFNNRIRRLEPIEPSEIDTTLSASYPSHFYFQNNSIVLYPMPSQSVGTVRIRYFQRPNRLEQTINCAQITSVNSVANTVTCSSVPSAWVTNNQVDFIPQTASQATPYGLNSVLTGVSGSTLSFSSLPTIPAGYPNAGAVAAVAGDWLALAEYTPIPEIPIEFDLVLAQAAVCAALEAAGDQVGLALVQPKLDKYVQEATLLITPRAQSSVKKVVSNWRRL